MAERSMARAWKACVPSDRYRGFKSLSLRIVQYISGR